ncbi:hypothetical protein PV410_12245 [Streptomyces sp. PA03-5A]|nr:hypothetical protein [Streptomyces sp. PA03-5A]
MSYDIYFLNRRPEQSWDDALEELEAQSEDVLDGPVTPELIDAWDRIVPQARGLLGELNLFETDETRELTHHATGIQASVFIDEVTITVPYWHMGDKAEHVLGMAYALGAIIERETGIQGYDPQVELPLSELSAPDGIAVMSTITNDLRERFGGSADS